MRSLQARLGLGLTFSLLVVFFILWLIIFPAIRTLAESHIASQLQHDSETLLSMLQVDVNGNIGINNPGMALVYKRPFSGHYFKISSNGQRLYSRSLWDHDFSLPTNHSQHEKVFHVDGPRGQPLLLSVQQYRKGNQPVTIAVAEDLSALETDIEQFQNVFMLTSGLLLVALVVIQILIIRGGLRPFRHIREELRQLERGKLSRLTEQAPTEIQPMIQEINRLLDTMVKRLQRSRHALGDLAHALKKPLTVLTQIGDDEAMRTHPKLHHSLLQQTTNMRQTTDHILKRARMAGEGPDRLAFDAEAEILSLIDTLKKMHQGSNCVIAVDIPSGLSLRMDREDLLELLGNLLDNAFKWARQQIQLRIRENEEGVCIEIEDDGPGITDDQLHFLSKRGSRLDEQIEGHGLGLAIARDIAALYGGQILFHQARNLGGLGIQIKLSFH